MTKAQFAKRYGLYILVQAMPTQLASYPRLLASRFRYRIFWMEPNTIRAKPGFANDNQTIRGQEDHLLNQMKESFVVHGTWDVDPRPFSLHPVVEDMFVHRLEPEQTETYQEMQAGVRRGDNLRAKNCRTVQDIDRWFANLITIHDNIKREGYRTQLRMGRPPVDEISVCIGRNGQPLLLRHGNHRLSIAKLLQLPAVPVIVRGVHSGWLEELRRMYPDRNDARLLELGLRNMEPAREGRTRGITGGGRSYR